MNLISLFLFTVLIGFLPGYCLWKLSNIREFCLLISHILSLLLFSVVLCVCGILRLSWGESLSIYLALVTTCIIPYLFQSIKKRTSIEWGKHLKDNLILLFICLLTTTYVLIAGIYDHVPSDILRHLERIQQAHIDIKTEKVFAYSLHDGLNDNYLYYYYASLLSLSKVDLNTFITWITFFNTTFIIYATWQFASAQFLNTHKKGVVFFIASLGCVFFALHKGIASFSFIRYYSLAPVMLTLPAFYLCIIYIDRWFKQPLRLAQWCTLSALVLFTALLHIQESLFVLIMLALLIVYYTLSSCRGINNQRFSNKALFSISGLLAIGLVLITLYVLTSTNSPHVDQDRVIALTVLWPVLPSSWFVLNPFHQLSQVITLWGVFVYFLAALHIKSISKNSLIFCGLLIPFATVLNPWFVEVFIRIRGIDALYRSLYAVPLAIAASYLVYLTFRNWSLQKVWKKALSISTLCLLIIPLFPLPFDSKVFSYSRVNDLREVPTKNSLRHWQDITDYINESFSKEIIYTDPITAYIVSATTDSYSPRYKFLHNPKADINFTDYTSDPISKYSGHLLLINLRDGGNSSAGEISGHWAQDILYVSKYYSKELLTYIESKPERLQLVWQKDEVHLFRIQK